MSSSTLSPGTTFSVSSQVCSCCTNGIAKDRAGGCPAPKRGGSDGQSEATGHELDYQTHTHQPDPPPEDSHELIRPLTRVCVCVCYKGSVVVGGFQALTTGGAKNERGLYQQCGGVRRAAQGNKDPTHTNAASNHVPLSVRAAGILLLCPQTSVS